MTTVQIEKRKRGVGGWITAILFWGFNIFMAFALFAGLDGAGDAIREGASEAERTGAAIGTTIGAGFILAIWALGALILGMMMFFTRGKKIIITKEA